MYIQWRNLDLRVKSGPRPSRSRRSINRIFKWDEGHASSASWRTETICIKSLRDLPSRLSLSITSWSPSRICDKSIFSSGRSFLAPERTDWFRLIENEKNAKCIFIRKKPWPACQGWDGLMTTFTSWFWWISSFIYKQGLLACMLSFRWVPLILISDFHFKRFKILRISQIGP